MIDDAMSQAPAIVHAMEATAFGEEADARLCGLMATLSLPLVREGRVDVEVEVVRGHWEPIDTVSIEAECIWFSRGANGHGEHWKFLRVEGIPPWRTRVRREKVNAL